MVFVDVLEPTGSNSLRVDDDTFNANRENRGAERRHLNARALRAAGTISSGSTSKGSMANEFAPPSAMTKCDRKSAHRSSTLNCQPTSLLKIADQLADAALSTKRQNNKELATWRSNSGGSGAEDEPAIAYVCTDAAPDEVWLNSYVHEKTFSWLLLNAFPASTIARIMKFFKWFQLPLIFFYSQIRCSCYILFMQHACSGLIFMFLIYVLLSYLISVLGASAWAYPSCKGSSTRDQKLFAPSALLPPTPAFASAAACLIGPFASRSSAR